MHIRRLNQEALGLTENHPARRFLEAFIACRQDCVGKELPPPIGAGIDQRWYSPSDARDRTFSELMYAFVSFDIVLDGWRSAAAGLTDLERASERRFRRLRQLLVECDAAARTEGNLRIVEMVRQTFGMLDQWDAYLSARVGHGRESR
jgi:hypothetical protein